MYVIENLKSEKVVWFFYEKELQKTNQEECAIGKVLRRKSNCTSNG